MTSVAPPPPTTLIANLRRLALTQTADGLDDLIARATRARWSPTALLETLAQAELDARAHRRLERQLQAARLGRFISRTSNGTGPSSSTGPPLTASSRSTSSPRARTSSSS